jgi:hypothetical protein
VSENTLDSFPNEDNRPFDLLSDNLSSNDRRDPLHSLSQINSTSSTNSADGTKQLLSSEALNTTSVSVFDIGEFKNNTFEGATFAPPMPDFLGNQNSGYVSPQLYDTIADISRVTILDTFKKVTIDGVVPQISNSTIDFSLNNTPRSSDVTNVGSSFSASSNLNTPVPVDNRTINNNDFFIDAFKQQSQIIENLTRRLTDLEEAFIPTESAQETDDSVSVEETQGTVDKAKSVVTLILDKPETKIGAPQTETTTTSNIGKDVKLGTTADEITKSTTQKVTTKLSDNDVKEIKELSKEQSTKDSPNKTTPDLPETANPESIVLEDSSETANPESIVLEDSSETANPESRALEDSSDTANPNSRALKDSSETANPNSRALKDSSETANPNSRPLKKDDKKDSNGKEKDPEQEGQQLDAKETGMVFPIIMSRADYKEHTVAYVTATGQQDINIQSGHLFQTLSGSENYPTDEYWYPNVFPKFPTTKGLYILGIDIQDQNNRELKWVPTQSC